MIEQIRAEIPPSYRETYTFPSKATEILKDDFVVTPECLKELDPDNPDDYHDFVGVYSILTHPQIAHHFSHSLTRDNPAELLTIARRDKRHIVVAKIPDELLSSNDSHEFEFGYKEQKSGVVFGTFTETDSSFADEQETFIDFFAIHPDVERHGLGNQMFQLALYHAMIANVSFTGVPRLKVFVGITEHGNHHGMERICRDNHLGWNQRLENQMVYISGRDYPEPKDGEDTTVNSRLIDVLCNRTKIERYPTLRYEMDVVDFIRRGARGEYEALNNAGLDQELREIYLPKLECGENGNGRANSNNENVYDILES